MSTGPTSWFAQEASDHLSYFSFFFKGEGCEVFMIVYHGSVQR